LTTPGELRVLSREVLEKAVAEGVKARIFGFGFEVEGKVECKYFGTEPTVSLSEGEYIIAEEYCKDISEKSESEPEESKEMNILPEKIEDTEKEKNTDEEGKNIKYKEIVDLKFKIPKGKIADISRGVLIPLQKAFEDLEITIKAKQGKISESDYDNKILETLRQIGVDVDSEDES
jgi:hypothetical protein